MMEKLIVLLLLSLFLSGLGLFVVRLYQKRRQPLPLIFLPALFAFLLLLPFSCLLPSLELSLFTSNSTRPLESTFSPLPLIALLWGLGICIGIIKCTRDHLAYTKWVSRTEPVRDQATLAQFSQICDQARLPKELPLSICNSISSPVFAGLRRPRVVLPAQAYEWSTETLQVALWHEIGHYKRKDLFTHYLSQLVCILYFFNPFLYRLKQFLIDQNESACDHWVINQGISQKSYVDALCEVAQSNRTTTTPVNFAMGMAHTSDLKGRVLQLIQKDQPKFYTAFTAMFLGALFLVSVIGMTLRFQSSASSEFSSKEIDTYLRLSANPFPGEN